MNATTLSKADAPVIGVDLAKSVSQPTVAEGLAASRLEFGCSATI